jgi:hypothetical protein
VALMGRPGRLLGCRRRDEEVPRCARLSLEFARDEILSLIDAKARRAGWDLGFVLRHYAGGCLDDFGGLAEAYAFCDRLQDDDPVFLGVRRVGLISIAVAV